MYTSLCTHLFTTPCISRFGNKLQLVASHHQTFSLRTIHQKRITVVRKEISSFTEYFIANGSVNLPMTSTMYQMMANEKKYIHANILVIESSLRLRVFTGVLMKLRVLEDIMPYQLVDSYRCFGGIQCFRLQS